MGSATQPTTSQPNDGRIPIAQKELSDANKSKVQKYGELVIGRPGLGAMFSYELVTLLSAWVPGALGLFLRSKLYPRLLGACGRRCGRDSHDSRRIPGRAGPPDAAVSP